MISEKHKTIWADSELIEGIGSFPLAKTVEHCGDGFSVDPFEVYAYCPKCGAQIKLRSFSASCEIEDVFDAIFLWMSMPGAFDVAERRRQKLIKAESEE
ncbi:MAG TPA: hypothetical protein VGW12_01670 [Pyrinomonadaceae bacterium]|nr:hypothetical protein [Pyrinomonadaceae bacterium]